MTSISNKQDSRSLVYNKTKKKVNKLLQTLQQETSEYINTEEFITAWMKPNKLKLKIEKALLLFHWERDLSSFPFYTFQN